MKKSTFLFILTFLNVLAFSQSDTSYYANKEIYTIIKDIGVENELNKFSIDVWYPNGEKMSSAICVKYQGNYRPVDYSVIYFENGKVFQEYKPKKNILLTYYEDGKIEKKLQVTEGKKVHKEQQFYKNGKLKEKKLTKDKTIKYSIVFYIRNNSTNRSLMSQLGSTSFYQKIKYHPNGKKMHKSIFVNNGEYNTYEETFYNERGKPDTLTKSIDIKENAYSNGKKKYGRWVEYYPSGNIYKVNNYHADLKHGLRLIWYKNGQIKDSIYFDKGKKTGEYKTWYEDGKVKMQCYYVNDVQDGTYLSFHSNGNIEKQGSYANGSVVGIFSNYDESGKILFEQIGHPMRQMETFYDYRNNKSKFIYDGSFKGIRDGVWKVKYPEKNTFYEAKYKNGVLDGQYILNDKDGTLVCKQTFENGWLEGKTIFYYKNGNKIFEGSYSHNKKSGIWTNYYDNEQKSSIKDYNDTIPWYYAEWFKDGTPKVVTKEKTKDNIKERHYYDEKGTLLYSYILPYGRKAAFDFISYYANGSIRKHEIHTTDKKSDYIKKEYYENGQLKYEVSIVDYKIEGTSKYYYEDGSLKSDEVFEYGIRNGEASYFDNAGNSDKKTNYEDGIELLERSKDTCTCNKNGEAIPANSFFNSLKSFIELDKINNNLNRFKVDTNYNHAFFRYDFPPSDKALYGKIMSRKDLYIFVDDAGLKVSLTPCRNSSNIGDVFINYRYNSSGKTNETEKHWLEIKVEDISIEFPKTILRRWDTKHNKVLIVDNEKNSPSRVLIPISKLTFCNLPEEHIEVIKTDSSYSCFTPSELTGTGIILTANDALVDFHSNKIAPKDRYDGVYSGMLYPLHEKYFFESNDFGRWFAEADDYLKNFMGVILPEANLKIPYKGEYIDAYSTNLLIDAREINGYIKIAKNKMPVNSNENKLRKHLSQLGLIIHNTPAALSKSNEDYIIIYFTFKAN